MLAIYPSLERMNAFVFGSPIYFDHVSAQGKTFIDRLICYSEGDRKGRFPRGLPAIVIITYEWDNPTAYDDVVDWIKGRFEHYFKMKVAGTLVAENTTDVPVWKRDDILEKAYGMGRAL